MSNQPHTSASIIRALAKQYHIIPSDSAGQHFMIDQSVIDDLVAAAGGEQLGPVLEIGPGFGTLTTALAEAADRVIAIELDTRFRKPLDTLQQHYQNLMVRYGDFFEQWPEVKSQLRDGNYSVAANLPYNITSLVFRHFLEQSPRPKQMTVLIQREVAERICAQPGAMSILSVSVQLYGQPEIVRLVPPSSFWPEPAVDSAIIAVRGIGNDPHGYISALAPVTTKQFFQVVKAGFSGRRKQIHNTLAAGLHIDSETAKKTLQACYISPTARAQELSIPQWISLSREIFLANK